MWLQILVIVVLVLALFPALRRRVTGLVGRGLAVGLAIGLLLLAVFAFVQH